MTKSSPATVADLQRAVKRIEGRHKKPIKKGTTSSDGFYFLSGNRALHYTKLKDAFKRYLAEHGSYPEGTGDILQRFLKGIENTVTSLEIELLEKAGLFEYIDADMDC